MSRPLLPYETLILRNFAGFVEHQLCLAALLARVRDLAIEPGRQVNDRFFCGERELGIEGVHAKVILGVGQQQNALRSRHSPLPLVNRGSTC